MLDPGEFSHGQPEDLDGVAVFGGEDHGGVVGVFGNEADAARDVVDAFQGGGIVNADGGNLTIIHVGGALDKNNVPFFDAHIYHGVATYHDSKVYVTAGVAGDIGFYMFIGVYRLSGGYRPEHGHHAFFCGGDV